LLNELASMRRGLTNAGIEVERRHPDVQEVSRNKRPLLVRLKPNGALGEIDLLPEGFTEALWTFREGKHNSFPSVSVPPLLDLPSLEREAFNKSWKGAAHADRRKALCQATATYPSGGQWWDRWPGKGLLESLRSKRAILAGIESEAAAVPEVIDRFLAIFGVDENGTRRQFLDTLLTAMLREVESGIADWLEVARATLVGEEKRDGQRKKLVGGEFYFDVAPGQFDRDVHDLRNRAAAARALSESGEPALGLCAITGENGQLHRGNFPQTNLPALGLSYVFSKNSDLPATGSYAQFGHDAFPVGRLVVGDLAGAITELVTVAHRAKTSRGAGFLARGARRPIS
jgi:hypothetical protein